MEKKIKSDFIVKKIILAITWKMGLGVVAEMGWSYSASGGAWGWVGLSMLPCDAWTFEMAVCERGWQVWEQKSSKL